MTGNFFNGRYFCIIKLIIGTLFLGFLFFDISNEFYQSYKTGITTIRIYNIGFNGQEALIMYLAMFVGICVGFISFYLHTRKCFNENYKK